MLVATLFVGVSGPQEARAADHEISEDPSDIWMTDGSGQVDDIVSIGNTVYVAGSFENVRPSFDGSDTGQSYLAAFDATSGELITGFDPEINKGVIALAASADGSVLYIGGTFSEVNGSGAWRVAALDPLTGERIPGFNAIVLEGDVHAMTMGDGDDLYIGGNFGKVNGFDRPYVAKLDGATGALFTIWDPVPNDIVRSLEFVSSNDTVYIGGDFLNVNGESGTKRLIGVHKGTGNITAPRFPGISLVRDLAASAEKLWVAGGVSGGKAFVYDLDTNVLLESWTTDGDAQAVEVMGDNVVFGGHWVSFFGQHVNKRIIMLDVETHDQVEGWEPNLQGDPGIFAIHFDGVNLWAGGGVTHSTPTSVRGFARFASTNPPADTTPPSKVTGVTGVDDNGDVELSWDPSTDGGGSVTYHIYRDGELYAITTDTAFTDIEVDEGDSYSYTIVAVDDAGNAAGPSTAVAVTPDSPGSGGSDGGSGGGGGGGGGVVDIFTDIDDSVFKADIEWLAASGITLGCNPPTNDKFCPNAVVTRGQMAAFLDRALDLPGGPEKFIDDDGSIFEANINALAASGITLGCNPPTNDKFCPNANVTRGQMAAFLVRAFGLPGGPEKFIDDDGSIFEANINALAASGITLGCNPPTNDKYCPNAVVTRGQMAAFLHRAEAYLP